MAKKDEAQRQQGERDYEAEERQRREADEVELSGRGGIRPETRDPDEYHDRTRDRELDEEKTEG